MYIQLYYSNFCKESIAIISNRTLYVGKVYCTVIASLDILIKVTLTIYLG